MSNEVASAIADADRSPEPEKTGVAPDSQKAGSPQVTVLPVRLEDKNAGLQASNVVSLFVSALIDQNGQQLTQVVEVFGNSIDRQLDHALEANEKLQKELRTEQVAHARTEEQLKTILQKDRKAAFLNALGGVVLGYGLSEITSTHGMIFSALGIVLLVVGCWPLLPRGKN